MKLDSFQEVVLESSSVEELKEKVKCLKAGLISSVGKHGDVIATKIMLHGDYFFFPQELRTCLFLLPKLYLLSALLLSFISWSGVKAFR